MNGEIPSVPITTLAGVASLTDLLTELPLPSPLPHTLNNKSLLYHPKVAEDARRLLFTQDPNLIQQLAHSLKQTSSEQIELKDNLAGDAIEGDIPELLKQILAKDPNAFKSSVKQNESRAVVGKNSVSSGQFNQHNQLPQQPSPYQAGQISPCPPGSPARFPPQPGGSPFGENAPSHGSSKFQNQFMQFVGDGKSDKPTVNGGLSGSPESNAASPPMLRRHSHQRSASMSSPAQASAAPPTREPHRNSTDIASRGADADKKRGVRPNSGEPVVLLEPLSTKDTSGDKRKRHSSRSKRKKQSETRCDLMPEEDHQVKDTKLGGSPRHMQSTVPEKKETHSLPVRAAYGSVMNSNLSSQRASKSTRRNTASICVEKIEEVNPRDGKNRKIAIPYSHKNTCDLTLEKHSVDGKEICSQVQNVPSPMDHSNKDGHEATEATSASVQKTAVTDKPGHRKARQSAVLNNGEVLKNNIMSDDDAPESPGTKEANLNNNNAADEESGVKRRKSRRKNVTERKRPALKEKQNIMNNAITNTNIQALPLPQKEVRDICSARVSNRTRTAKGKKINGPSIDSERKEEQRNKAKLEDTIDVESIEPTSKDLNSASRRLSSRSESGRSRSGSQSILGMEHGMQPRIKLTRIDALSSTELDAKLKNNRRHDRHKSNDRRGHKRRHSDEEDDDWTPHANNSFGSSLSERVKRRRQIESDSEEEKPAPSPEVPRRRKKDKKIKRQSEMQLTAEELMDTATFKKFSTAIETVLDMAEDIDLTTMNNDDDDLGSGAIVQRSTLMDLCREAAKLRAMGRMNQVPYEKLVKLLSILQLNIKDGCKVLPAITDADGDDEPLWKEVAMEKVMCAVDASLTALYIMTSTDMPKEVYIEDVIERIGMMAKLQITNTIFPEFDPVYKIDPKNKHGIQSNMKMKRARANTVKHKSTVTLYNKLTELLSIFAELIDIQELTDTIILQMSTLSVSPFFVENISELQLSSLKLVTNIFSRYEKHRQLIMEDILSSLARLPSSKKNLRNYRLNSEEQIQMVTALALQLIQCVVRIPQPENDDGQEELDSKDKEKREKQRKAELLEKELVIVTSYETAMRTAHNFLVVFLKKCTIKGEEDYRSLFENFVYDLLSTVNKPEWPAAELLLSLLGRLLVQQFSNKSVDMSLRVASLDYLGIVAARLRKDSVTSRLNQDVIDEIIDQIKQEEKEIESDEKKPSNKKSENSENSDLNPCLQKALLDYLAYDAQSDPSLVFSRQFYVAQWYRDCSVEAEKLQRRQERYKMDDEDDEKVAEEMDKQKEILQLTQDRKDFLVSQMLTNFGAFAKFKPSPSKLDYENGLLITQYLASNRPFSQSFDIYLTQILKVLCETAVAVRTKAMKCLTAVVEADPAILARNDMQQGVHGRFLDQSTSVREAAVELVGKFILIRPELTAQYYDMLSDRILDTGISVRKRVIKIFRDICIEQTDFPKIPEMCVKMIRRVNDEEGIKKLVTDTFQTMWFTPLRDKDSHKLLTRVMNITDVVLACKDAGYDWIEHLLENLLKKEEDSNQRPVERACTQIVDCLVENVLRLEEGVEGAAGKSSSSTRLVSCFSTLYLFCKVKSEFLVPHAPTIQPYLNIKCSSQSDFMVLHNVARILELTVPLMEHPSETFLAQLEEDMMKLILKHGMLVLQSCVSCLGSVVNNVTHNYKLVRDCFQKFFGVLSKIMVEHQKDPKNPALTNSRPTLLRSLFTVGLLCKHFNFDSEDFGEKRPTISIRDRVFDVLFYFISHEDEDVKLKSLTGLGNFCVRHFEFMLGKTIRELYGHLLSDECNSLKMRVQVLRNLQLYLNEEEEKMMHADAEYRKFTEESSESRRKSGGKEDLKEMGDIQSGMASTVIQVYLKAILEAFFHPHQQVRLAGLSVVILILRQGLVHPVQCVPYLICMGTDCDIMIRNKADAQLAEIDKKYSGFIQMKGMQGMKFSFRLQSLIQAESKEPTRGIRIEENQTVALNHFLYNTIRSSRGHRRAMLSNMLNMFDETAKCTLPELVYMADNLAYFPYVHQDEPLYVIHQIDILVSVSGSNLLQSFQEYFYPGSTEEGADKKKLDDDEDEAVDILVDAVSRRVDTEDDEKKAANVQQLQDLYLASQGCVLLLVLKQHLKDQYGFTDSKIHRYSPTEPSKVFDKPLNRRHGVKFQPKQVFDIIAKGPLPQDIPEEEKRFLVEAYLDFKDLMLSIDPADEDEDDGPSASASGRGTPAGAGTPARDAGAAPVEGATTEDGQPVPTTNGEPVTPRVDLTSSTLHRHRHSHHSSKRNRHTSSRQRHSSSHSHSHSSSHHKPHKHKKKKKRRRTSDDESDADDTDSDPDFVA